VKLIAPLVKEGVMVFGKEAAAFRAEWHAAARREVAFRIMEGLETIEITRRARGEPVRFSVGSLALAAKKPATLERRTGRARDVKG
jgi:hypothetical protein